MSWLRKVEGDKSKNLFCLRIVTNVFSKTKTLQTNLKCKTRQLDASDFSKLRIR